jgi:hypothetical protein
MEKRKIIKISVIVFLCLSLALNAVLIWSTVKNWQQFVQAKEAESKNSKILTFTDLFISKVLMGVGEIDLDTRLQLESSVRALNDQDILSQWQKFTNSGDQASASKEAKNLLNLLIKKATH